ncbi:MAG: hypothetical protein ABIR96_10740 [Bdellovibrionota bacterium]
MQSRSAVFSWIGIGALLGALVASWLAPKGIAWYFDPPVNIGVNCKAATEWSMSRLLIAQFWGLVIGTVASLAIATLLRKRRARAHRDI